MNAAGRAPTPGSEVRMWWMALAHAAEPCVPPPPRASAAPVRVHAHVGMPADPLVRKFVTDPQVAAWASHTQRVVRVEVEHVPLTLLPDGHRLETALRLAGAQRVPGGPWRIGGAEPRLYVDGVAMDSNLR